MLAFSAAVQAWSMRLSLLLPAVWYIPFRPLLAQSPVSLTLDGPLCSTCKWELQDSQPMRGLVHDRAFFLGAIPSASIDPSGRVLVTDLAQHQVLRLDLQAGGLLRIGRQGSGPGEFESPLITATGADGHIFVYDISLGRVSEFDSLGVFLGSFLVPFRLFNAWSMTIDDRGELYISGTTPAKQQAPFVIHMFTRSGRWLRSFGDASADFPDFLERLYGDAGPLWWDADRRSLWFSRGGPLLELLRFSPDGVLLTRVRLADGRLKTWKPLMQTEIVDGRTRVSAATRKGTIALVAIPGGMLVNVTMSDDSGTMRYDAFRTQDGILVGRWFQRHQSPMAYIGLGDGKRWVFELTPRSDQGLIRYRVRFQAGGF